MFRGRMQHTRARPDNRGMPHLITPGEIVSARDSGRRVRLLDVRWRLDAPEGRPEYIDGHLPDAVYVDLERELARPGYPEEGRYPLPTLHDLERALRRWGVDDGDLVVAYDDNHSVAAARVWWLLRRRGVDIRVLDGGIRAWVRAGNVLERGDHAPAPGNATLRDADLGIATIDDAARAHVDGYLVDVRAPEHYRCSRNARPGRRPHPGALNIPVVTHIARDESADLAGRDPGEPRRPRRRPASAHHPLLRCRDQFGAHRPGPHADRCGGDHLHRLMEPVGALEPFGGRRPDPVGPARARLVPRGSGSARLRPAPPPRAQRPLPRGGRARATAHPVRTIRAASRKP